MARGKHLPSRSIINPPPNSPFLHHPHHFFPLSLSPPSPSLAHLPFCFLTNGGGVSEARKAEELSSWFGLSIPPSLVCLSHTPMRALLPTLQHSRILVLGMTDVASVATSYGFTDVVTMADIAVQHPHLVPHLTHSEPGGHSIHTPTPSPPSPHPPSPPIDLASIRAIFVMHDPNAWYRDMQLLIDVLTASTTPPPLYFTNPDFLFTGKAAKPRLAQGAFRVGLEAMWKEYTGGAQLPYQLMGKPEIVTFRWAERMLSDRAKEMGFARVDERIMVGDNPAADIRGGNRAGWETTILVETGTIERSNRKEDQPTMVAANVLEAVKLAIDKDWRRRESS